MDMENIREIVRRARGGKAGLISALEEIQSKYTYLPEEALRLVASETGLSLTDIYGVATFYKAFSLTPRGKHCISACVGTACHVRGAEGVVEEFKKQLDLEPGETTPDNEITFETVNCLGACALGPIVVSDGHYYANIAAKNITDMIERTKTGVHGSGDASNDGSFPFTAACPHCGRSFMDEEHHDEGRPSIRVEVMNGNEAAWIRMPSVYGKFDKQFGPAAVPEGSIVVILCPHCHKDLESIAVCMECGAPMAAFDVNGKDGTLMVCMRTDCSGHLLTLNGADS